MVRIASPFLVCLVSFFAVAAVAQQPAATVPSYDVELVIFRVKNPTGSPEDWSREEKAAQARLAISDEESTTESSSVATANFPTLPAGRLKLNAAEETLKRNRNFEPIVHLAWTQPGFGFDAAVAVPVDATSPDGAHVTGRIILSRGRYLHLAVDLIYDPPSTAPDAGHRYVIKESRRMRSTERHYIDHPHFGVLALITPVNN